MGYKNDYVNGSPYVAQTRINDGKCDFGIARIPCTVGDGGFDTMQITMAELLETMENNICYVVANGIGNGNSFIFHSEIFSCYYDTDNSVYVAAGNDVAFVCATLDDYPQANVF